MPEVLKFHEIDRLAPFRQAWAELLQHTPGGCFFQSLEWLEIYWRHFGQGQKLRVLVVLDQDRTTGILPLVLRTEPTRAGRIRVLTFPLHGWGSFYGPIGPNPKQTLVASLDRIRNSPRDWDMLELRWQGAPGTNPADALDALHAAGFPAYATVWDRAAAVDLDGTWESYWSARKGAWLRRFRHAEQRLAEQGEVSYVRFRPLGAAHGEASPRWDLYEACEAIARESWQAGAANGTTLTHQAVRSFLREAHEAASAAGAVDLNLLLLDGKPAAFIYGYHAGGYVYGLRRGYDAQCCREGTGNILLARTLHDSFARGDRIYDMGVGSLPSKRHFQTRLLPILRFSHFPPWALRSQLLRAKRLWQNWRDPASIAVGRALDGAADSR